MVNDTFLDQIYNLNSIEQCHELGGLLVKPTDGKVTVFYNLYANGTQNPQWIRKGSRILTWSNDPRKCVGTYVEISNRLLKEKYEL